MNKIKLEICPFCGSNRICSDHLVQIKPIRLYDVYCLKCGCGTKGFPTKEQAINIWNTRQN